MEQTRLQQVLQKSLFMQGGKKKIKLGDVFAKLRESPGEGFNVPSPFLSLSRWFYCDHRNNSQQLGLSWSGIPAPAAGSVCIPREGTQAMLSLGDPAGMGVRGLPRAHCWCGCTALGTLLAPSAHPPGCNCTSMGCPKIPEAPRPRLWGALCTPSCSSGRPHAPRDALCTPLWTLSQLLE